MSRHKTHPKKKRFLIAVGAIATLLIFSFFAPLGRYFEIAKNIEIFAAAFKDINNIYVEDINPNKLIRSGINAMLETLDPYTRFIPEDEIENYRTTSTGQYGGIGATTRTIEGHIIVTMVYKDYPAAQNGLKIGDEIIMVGTKELTKISAGELSQLIRGQVGSEVQLTVKRTGMNELLQLHLIRQKIKIKNVPYYSVIDGDIGYIRLTNFMPKASAEVKNALTDINNKNPKGIILDLRGNPGGLLLEAVRICEFFLPKGSLIVTTKGKRKKSNLTYSTRDNPINPKTPLVILIDNHSASASEILAGSVQDYDRGVIIGRKSFGKGLVQLNLPLPYNAQLKVTTAKYYTPSGRCIQTINYNRQKKLDKPDLNPKNIKKEFKTTNGRIVYDGGGINPDITVPLTKKHAFSKMLGHKGFILNYATKYYQQHPTISDSKTFVLNDKQYAAFIAWMNNKNYDYQSSTEQEMEVLKEIAEREQRIEELTPPLEGIMNKLQKSNEELLIAHDSEIKSLLEENIIAQYYLEKGIIEHSLVHDPMTTKSITVLRDTSSYKKILKTL